MVFGTKNSYDAIVMADGLGAFNLISGLSVALSDSIPILAITGYEAADVLLKGD